MPVEYFLRYNGQCYDVGTRLKFQTSAAPYASVLEGKIEWISHNHIYIRLTDGSGRKLSKMHHLDSLIVEIIDPVYYQEPSRKPIRGGPRPPEDDVFVGWVWYIVIMLVGVIFKDRLTIWVFSTAVFFLWKNGCLNGGNK